jgi:hypothetical protein
VAVVVAFTVVEAEASMAGAAVASIAAEAEASTAALQVAVPLAAQVKLVAHVKLVQPAAQGHRVPASHPAATRWNHAMVPGHLVAP